MKYIYFLSFLLSFSVNLFSQCDVGQVVFTEDINFCDNNSWVLVFEDNFDDNNLDLSVWTYGPRNRYCNDEQQYYTRGSNIILENGILRLITKKETIYAKTVDWKPENEHLYCHDIDRGQNARYFYYTSSNIETKKKFSYGRFEARIRIPKGKGFWPAFWTYGGDPWNEIDIFEFWNEDNIWGNYDPSKLSRIHHVNSWYDFDNDGHGNNCSDEYIGVDFSEDFHIFTMIWSRDNISWLVDGQLKKTLPKYYDLELNPISCDLIAFHHYFYLKTFPKDPMSIIFNLAIQSGGNSPDNSTPFPSEMEVDWVRYYQSSECQDINITEASQIQLDNHVFNVISGGDIKISCDFTLQNGQQLEIVAKSSITLEPGFTAEEGSTFCARIDPTLCTSKIEEKSVDSLFDLNPKNKKTPNFQIKCSKEKDNNINIFPNPNKGLFKIDFNNINYDNFKIKITKTNGQEIYFLDKIQTPILNINIGNTKGVYFLYLFNNEEKSVFVYKIILQ